MPIILNIIENSRKGAATDSAYGYKDSVNKYYISELQNHNKLKLDGKYTINSNGSLTPAEDNTFGFGDENVTSFPVQVSGTVPSSGELTYENNVLKSGYLVIGDYRVTFNQGGTVTTVKNSGSSSNEQSNSGQTSEQENTITHYVYSNDYENAHLTSANEGSTEKPETTNYGDGVYLRYGVSNDVLITPPDTCINEVSDTERGELCLSYGVSNFENNTTLIKEYFNIADNEIEDGSYQTNGLECTFNSEESYCSNGSGWIVSAYSDGRVTTEYSSYTFFCEVDSANEYYCNGQ